MATSSASIVHTSANASSSSPLPQHGVVFSTPIGPPSPSSAHPVAPTAPSTQPTGTTASRNGLPTTAGPPVGVLVGYVGASSIPSQSPTTATAHGHGRPSHSQFLLTASFGNVLGAVVLVLTAIGLGWGLGAGVVGLDLQKWAARNDALQSCLSWESTGHYSDYCNETIKAGVTRPPLMRRTPAHLGSWLPAHGSASQLALLATATLCVCVFTLVYFRPRMHPFRPVISSVRTHQPQRVRTWNLIVGNAQHTTTKSIQNTEDVLRDASTIYWLGPDEPGHIGTSNDLGRRIGVFYDSEGDSDSGSHAGNDEYDVSIIRNPSFPIDKASVPWSIATEEGRISDVNFTNIAEPQGSHTYLMSWFWRQDPDDETLCDGSDSKPPRLPRFKADALHAAIAESCRKIGELRAEDKRLAESQLLFLHERILVLTATRSARYSLLWVMTGEASELTRTRDYTLLSRRYACVEDLRALGDKCIETILRAGYRPARLSIDVGELRKSWHESVDRLQALAKEAYQFPQQMFHSDLLWMLVDQLIDLTISAKDTHLRPEDGLTLCPVSTDVGEPEEPDLHLRKLHCEIDVLAYLLSWLLLFKRQADDDLDSEPAPLVSEQMNATGIDNVQHADPLDLSDDGPSNNDSEIAYSGSDIDEAPDTGDDHAQQAVAPEQPSDGPNTTGDELEHPPIAINKPPNKAARPFDSFKRFLRRTRPKLQSPG